MRLRMTWCCWTVPPLLPVTDAVVLTKMSGGAVVIVGADRIHRPQLQQSLQTLETADAQLSGLS
jgi:Mrp family chromosome partitioning ATPase